MYDAYSDDFREHVQQVFQSAVLPTNPATLLTHELVEQLSGSPHEHTDPSECQ